ncbi:MAG TPA: transposase [Bryobacteraceae bacterium]
MLQRLGVKREQMDQQPYRLDRVRRATVLAAVRAVCLRRGWDLWAAHARTNHVHVVVEAKARPEMVLQALKAYSSRELNRIGGDQEGRKRWARHGSTRWLWKDDDVRAAVEYVVARQGEKMEVYVGVGVGVTAP